MIEVAAVGSLHLDIMVDAPRLPRLDETLIGKAWGTKCGGKGGNQAVAAARFGAKVGFGGQIGADDFGARLKGNLVAAGVDVACVDVDSQAGSGMSVAITEAGGEYGAVVVSGANLTIDAAAVAARWSALWEARLLLLQNEIPEAVSLAAARAVKARGGRVMLNAAPARVAGDELLGLVDILIVNRVEAEMISGESDPDLALKALASASRDVILTRGGAGLSVMDRNGVRTDMAALKVNLISSHGAGDCFCGALAARLAKGDDLLAACNYARVAAGMFVAMMPEQQAGLSDHMVRERMKQEG